MSDAGNAYRMANALDRAVRQAERLRAMRKWKPWERVAIPAGMIPGDGWASTFTTAAQNGCFSVLMRDLQDGTTHAMISTLPGSAPPTWAEKQRIKDTLCGARVALTTAGRPDDPRSVTIACKMEGGRQ